MSQTDSAAIVPAVIPQSGGRSFDGNRRPKTRPIDDATLSLAADRLAIQITVFVAGPFVDKAWSGEQWEAAPASARLRRAVWRFVEEQRHSVFLGEHRGVNEITEANIPNRASATVSELYMSDKSDAIIIIPDSPGSFCELGAWAVKKNLCSKMLILVRREFESDISYINNGVLRSAAHKGAQVNWISYDDVDTAVDIVGRFIDLTIDNIVADRIENG